MTAPVAPPSPRALVPFVSVTAMMQIVHRIGLPRVLTDIAGRIEAYFLRWDSFARTARIPAHSEEGVIELMPTSDGETYGFKYVNGHPANRRKCLQTVTAFGLLVDLPTGYPLLLSEMTLLTALRTAATSAVAARHLAPAGARAMTLIGNGAQSEFQALAFRHICGIDHIRLFDSDPKATSRCARNLEREGLSVTRCATAEEAVEGAHIVTTVTADKRHSRVLSPNMVGPGIHINAGGGHSPGKTEIDPEILCRAAIFVEYAPQTRIEGEIQQLASDHTVTELWQVIAGRAPGRRDPREVTLFDSAGFAIEDFAALAYIRDKALETVLYSNLDMVADPDDPRELFGMLMRAAP